MISPEEYAVGFMFDLNAYDLLSPRSRHGDDGGVGASNFGCREEMRRILSRCEPTDSPGRLPALVGSYIDRGVREARAAANPELLLDLELTCTLPNGFAFPVHPDEIDPGEPSATNYKTKNGLAAIRRGFVDDQARIQRHLEYHAAHQAGLVPAEGIVRNVFIDRSGADPNAHVEQEPFSMTVVGEAVDFVDDVLYAREHGEEARKDRPRTFCRSFCQFYTACRVPEIDVEEITDPNLAAKVDAAGDALAKAKIEQQVADELKADGLKGLTGRTSRYSIVSKWINSAKQTPHWRVEIEELTPSLVEERAS